MIYLSFDIEEFDMPKEYGYDIPFGQQISVSREGLIAILDLLKKYDIRATFFSTVIFAEQVADLIHRLIDEGHELASHSYYHSEFKIDDLENSRETLEGLFKVPITGLRMPRMKEVNAEDVKRAGFEYNSSINPTYLPGRYNKLSSPKRYFREGDLWQIPAAVSWFRIPLFWLSFHNFPLWLYKFLLKRCVASVGYAALYFHPWEFTDLHQKEYNFPSYVMRNSGEQMIARFEQLLQYIKKQGWKTGTYNQIITNK